MSRDPLTSITTRATPQTQPADPRQVPNNATGHSFVLTNEQRLRRFLMLGVAGGTFYVRDRPLAIENAQVVIDLSASDHATLVRTIVDVSTSGHAPKQLPTLFALAIAASNGTVEQRQVALDALPAVARTATHMFAFVDYVQQFRGWGPALKRAIARWYLNRPIDQLAYQVVKYRNRISWTHRDVLRKAHPKPQPGNDDLVTLFDWICDRNLDRWGRQALVVDDPLLVVEGFERIKQAERPEVAASIVQHYKLPWEAIPDRFVNSVPVWETLLTNGVPQTALLRQLPRLTRLGMLQPGGRWTRLVVDQLTDLDRLVRARVHPFNVLVAQRTYAQGHGERGKSRWTPSRPIIDALDAAFYAAFGAIEPTNQRVMLALDLSASMTWTGICNSSLTPRDASAALALVTAATEPNYNIVGFTASQHGISELPISPRQRLDDAINVVRNQRAGGTDCALPMLYALENNLEVDTFVIYTDNETWAGQIHPHEALVRYRQRMGINARLVVVGMTSTGFTIADPSDAGSLDVVGFDTATPQLISDFTRGEV